LLIINIYIYASSQRLPQNKDDDAREVTRNISAG